MKRIIWISAALVLAGCALEPVKYSGAEYASLTTRTYKNIKKEDVFSATKEIFELADPTFKVTKFGDEIKASRSVGVLFNTITYSWRVLAEARNADVLVTTEHQTQIDTTDLPSGWEGSYKLFYARLDYLLGKSNHWLTCSEAADARGDISRKRYGSLEALCWQPEDRSPQTTKRTNR